MQLIAIARTRPIEVEPPAEGVVHVGAAPEPADVSTWPASPVAFPEPTPIASVVLSDRPVVPLDCNAKTPLVSAVVLTPEEPDTTPLSALIVDGMCYPSALILVVRACNSASSCSFVGAGGGAGGFACCANTAASSASLAASSSAVNGTGPSAVM